MLTGTKNFSVGEALAASGGSIPPEYQANAQATLELLQAFRDILGRPIFITSLWRSAAHNLAVPGHADDSQHLVADGADFNVLGMTDEQAVLRLWEAEQAGQLPPYHQLIVYAGDNHVHVGRGSDRKKLVKLTSGNYATLTLDYLKQHVATSIAITTLLVGGLLLYLLLPPRPRRTT